MFEGVCEPTVAGVQAADPFALAVALAPLTEQQLSQLSLDEAECVVAATQRVINALSARQAVAVETFADRAEDAFRQEEADYEARWRALAAEDGDEDWRPTPALTHRPRPEQVAGAMLAPILRLAPRTMVSRIRAARSLSYLPRTFALAWAGDLEPHRAAIVTGVVERVGIDHWMEFEARLHHTNVVPLTGSQLKARALKIALRLEHQDGDMDQAQRDRWVRIEPNDSPGSTKWTAQLPADRSQQMWAAIDQLASEYVRANPALTIEQARADAMADLLLTDVQVDTTVQIVVPADSGAVDDSDVPAAEPDSVPDSWVDSLHASPRGRGAGANSQGRDRIWPTRERLRVDRRGLASLSAQPRSSPHAGSGRLDRDRAGRVSARRRLTFGVSCRRQRLLPRPHRPQPPPGPRHHRRPSLVRAPPCQRSRDRLPASRTAQPATERPRHLSRTCPSAPRHRCRGLGRPPRVPTR